MKVENSLDQDLVIPDKSIVLYSQRSIFLLCLLASPFFGFVLFAMNLLKIGQKKSIMGHFLFFTWCYLFASFPIFGFENMNIILLLLISRVILAFLLIGFLWKRSFQEHSYQVVFPLVKVLMLLAIYYSYKLAPLVLEYYKSLEYDPLFQIASFNSYMIFLLLTLLVVIYFIFLIIRGVWHKIKGGNLN